MSNDPVSIIHDTYLSRFTDRIGSRSEGTVEECGSITLVSSGAPVRLANMGFVFEPPRAEALREAADWMAARDVSFVVNVAEGALPRVEALSDDSNLVPAGLILSGMLRPSLDDLPPNESEARITEVTTPEEATESRRVFESVFDVSFGEASNGSVPDERTHAFVGRMDGAAVATGSAYRVDEVASVFGMGVLSDYRGRGIGTAICSTALRSARDAGCRLATLESTPMAVSLYETLGFETYLKYHLYELGERANRRPGTHRSYTNGH